MRRFLSSLTLAIALLSFPAAASAGDWSNPSKIGAQNLTKQEADRKLTYFVGTIAAMVAGLVGYQFRRVLHEMVIRRPNYQDVQFCSAGDGNKPPLGVSCLGTTRRRTHADPAHRTPPPAGPRGVPRRAHPRPVKATRETKTQGGGSSPRLQRRAHPGRHPRRLPPGVCGRDSARR